MFRDVALVVQVFHWTPDALSGLTFEELAEYAQLAKIERGAS